MVLIVANAATFIFIDPNFAFPPNSNIVFITSLAWASPILILMITLSGIACLHWMRNSDHGFAIPGTEIWLFLFIGVLGGAGLVSSVIDLLNG